LQVGNHIFQPDRNTTVLDISISTIMRSHEKQHPNPRPSRMHAQV